MNGRSLRGAVGILAALTLILTSTMSVSAARWWASNQLFWAAGPACRDGVVVQGREMFHGLELGHEFLFEARPYAGSFGSYPVLADEGDGVIYPVIDPVKLGRQIGALTLVKQALQAAPLLYDDNGETDFTFDYSYGTLLWRSEQPVGAVVTVKWAPTERYVVLEVEDCYLAPDAPKKIVGLALQATVDKDPDSCSTDTTLFADPGEDVYACLVLQNAGGVAFTGHEVSADNYAIDSTLAFALTPGTRISITHALVESAGLDLNLGPFTDPFDVTNEVMWVASGEGGADTDSARSRVFRNSNVRVYLPMAVK